MASPSGIINSSAYTGEITYSNVTSRERWQIPVEGLAINGRQVAIESSNRNPALRTPQAVVDTSSPYIYVPRRVARAVYDIIRGENSAQGSDDLYQFNDGRSAEVRPPTALAPFIAASCRSLMFNLSYPAARPYIRRRQLYNEYARVL